MCCIHHDLPRQPLRFRGASKEETMPRRMLYRAMLVTIACAVLLSMAPGTAGAWGERMTGTIGSWNSGSRPVVSEALRNGGARAVSGAQDMFIPLFISAMILGLSLGLLLGYRVLRRWQGRQERQRDIDRLIEQFQALFREIDQGKKQSL
jgi:hypothetical protein